MRTNIEIDDVIMQAALRGGEFKTKKEAVEAGLKLIARQAHYREILKWEGKLHWDDQPDLNPTPEYKVMESTQLGAYPSDSHAPMSKRSSSATGRVSTAVKKKAAA